MHCVLYHTTYMKTTNCHMLSITTHCSETEISNKLLLHCLLCVCVFWDVFLLMKTEIIASPVFNME